MFSSEKKLLKKILSLSKFEDDQFGYSESEFFLYLNKNESVKVHIPKTINPKSSIQGLLEDNYICDYYCTIDGHHFFKIRNKAIDYFPLIRKEYFLQMFCNVTTSLIVSSITYLIFKVIL